MMLDNGVIPEVMERISADDYYLPRHQEIHRSIISLYDAGKPVDLPLVSDDLERRGKLDEVGGYVGLAGLAQYVLSTGAAPEIADRLKEKSTLRRLMRAAESILSDCADESRQVDDQVDRAEKLVFELSQESNARSFVSIEEVMGEALEEIGKLRAMESPTTGVPTGYVDLDGYLNGLHKKNLLILAARPSIGKTAFALNLMLNIAEKGTPCAIFSLEMGADQLTRRLLCSHAQVPGHLVASGRVKEADFQKLRKMGSELGGFPIFIDDTPGLTLMQLRARARRLKARQPDLGFIVVDYLQLMRSGERNRESSRQQEVSEISRGLKELANELDLPLMALSQLSRNIEQRSGKDKSAKPMLSDLRESGAIEQDADIVMFVHRERVDAQKNEDGSVAARNLPIPTDIIIGKHRNGPIGTANLMFFADFTKFTNAARS
jgi:replicative DNA helicase